MRNYILLIEDDGYLLGTITDKFSGFEIKFAHSYLTAQGMWMKYKNEINFIIMDLNINPDGLDTDKNNKYFPVNGIAFIEYISEGLDENDINELYNKIIFYSGYTEELNKKINMNLFDENIKKIKVYPKSALSISDLEIEVKKRLNK